MVLMCGGKHLATVSLRMLMSTIPIVAALSVASIPVMPSSAAWKM